MLFIGTFFFQYWLENDWLLNKTWCVCVCVHTHVWLHPFTIVCMLFVYLHSQNDQSKNRIIVNHLNCFALKFEYAVWLIEMIITTYFKLFYMVHVWIYQPIANYMTFSLYINNMYNNIGHTNMCVPTFRFANNHACTSFCVR